MIKVSITSERGDSLDISIPESMEEMKGKDFMKTITVLENIPEFLLSFLSLSAKDKEEAFENISPDTLLEMLDFYIRLLEAVTGESMETVKDLPLLDDKGGAIFALGSIVMRFISEYKPKEIREFQYKGDTYKMPEIDMIEISNITQKSWGANMKTGEVIEALQRAKIFSQRGEEGDLFVDNGLFYSDLGMVASLARKVDQNGVEEGKPLGLSAFSDFVNKRMAHFEDLPASVLRDAAFFLWDSSRKSALMSISNTSFKGPQGQRITPRKQRGSGAKKSN